MAKVKEVVNKAEGKEVQKTKGFDLLIKEIRSLTKDSKTLERQITTGSSFFEGSTRFCKLVKTSDDLIYLELNVKVPNLPEHPDIKTFTRVEASKKHLGTMTHLVRTRDKDMAIKVLKMAWKTFREQQDKQENKDK